MHRRAWLPPALDRLRSRPPLLFLRYLMNRLAILLLLASPCFAVTPASPLPSGVWRWSDLPVQPTAVGERRAIIDGTTLDLAPLLVHASTVAAGQAAHAPHAHPELEELVIVKSGRLTVTWGGQETVLGPGGFALLTDGIRHGLTNRGSEPATYYVIRYRTAAGAGGEGDPTVVRASLARDWADLPFQPFATGGRRQMFDRPTPMLENFEVHATTLNAGLQNHLTHTHRVEELVVILAGEIEMQIGDEWHRAAAGDVIFLASQVPHALRNVGQGPTDYYAIQWRVAETTAGVGLSPPTAARTD